MEIVTTIRYASEMPIILTAGTFLTLCLLDWVVIESVLQMFWMDRDAGILAKNLSSNYCLAQTIQDLNVTLGAFLF